MTRQMKRETLVLLSHEYPPYVFGGAATFSKQVAEWLSERGWRVVAIVGRAGIHERVLINKISDRLTVMRLYFPEIPPRWLFYAKFVRSYVERLAEKSCRIILSNNPLTGLAVPKNIKNSLHIITFFHGSVYSLLSLVYYASLADITKISLPELAYYSEVPLIRYLTKKDLLLSDTYVFVAKHVMKEFENLYTDLAKDIRNKGVIMYPGIEHSRLANLRKNVEKVDIGKIIVAFVGRLYYTKGVVHAIRAAKALSHELNIKDVELWIFGKGPLEYWVKYYIGKREDLKGGVKLFGFVERAKLLTLLAKYVDVLIHPSLYEGAPLVIMEAQALGIPVVAYDLPWTSEFIVNELNGLKARYPSITELAYNILKASKLNRDKISSIAEIYGRTRSFRILEKSLQDIVLET